MADSEVRQKFDAWKASLPSAWKPTHDLEGPRRELIVPLEAFAAGMRAGEIARWIPVEEKLPPPQRFVLVYYSEDDMEVTWHTGEVWSSPYNPTHWQPLPAAPEEKKP